MADVADFRVAVDFADHRKTRRLVDALGEGAVRQFLRLLEVDEYDRG